MKHGKNPTLAQKVTIEGQGLNPRNWLVVKALVDKLVIVHRKSGTVRELQSKGSAKP